jgi:hypothetical protein
MPAGSASPLNLIKLLNPRRRGRDAPRRNQKRRTTWQRRGAAHVELLRFLERIAASKLTSLVPTATALVSEPRGMGNGELEGAARRRPPAGDRRGDTAGGAWRDRAGGGGLPPPAGRFKLRGVGGGIWVGFGVVFFFFLFCFFGGGGGATPLG